MTTNTTHTYTHTRPNVDTLSTVVLGPMTGSPMSANQRTLLINLGHAINERLRREGGRGEELGGRTHTYTHTTTTSTHTRRRYLTDRQYASERRKEAAVKRAEQQFAFVPTSQVGKVVYNEALRLPSEFQLEWWRASSCYGREPLQHFYFLCGDGGMHYVHNKHVNEYAKTQKFWSRCRFPAFLLVAHEVGPFVYMYS